MRTCPPAGADVIIPGPELDSVSMPLSAGANETIAVRHARARSEERASPTHVPPAHQSMKIDRSTSAGASIVDRSSPDHRMDVTGGPKSTGYAGATKAKAKSDGKDSLRKLFKLPDDEVLIEEYLCALYKKILLQGRMYLFRNYVCFYSNVFGYQKNKVIPLKDVTIVRRAYTVKVVPNAIEIVCNGKCEFFTSFIFPDRAYRNITNAWKECSQYAKIFAAADVDNSKVAAEMLVVPKFSSPPSAEVAAMLGLRDGGGRRRRRRRRRLEGVRPEELRQRRPPERYGLQRRGGGRMGRMGRRLRRIVSASTRPPLN